MRIAFISIATLALVLLAMCEVGVAYPVAWWLYVSVAVVFAVALIRPVPVRTQFGRIGVLAAVIAIIAALYFVEWTSREPFLRDLARVQIGMTEAEVRHIMGRYMEGTGLQDLPGSSPSDAPSTLTILGSGSQFSVVTSPSGEMVVDDSLVFRHSNDAAFNSDWGIVSFSSGKVVAVEFSPD